MDAKNNTKTFSCTHWKQKIVEAQCVFVLPAGEKHTAGQIEATRKPCLQTLRSAMLGQPLYDLNPEKRSVETTSTSSISSDKSVQRSLQLESRENLF